MRFGGGVAVLGAVLALTCGAPAAAQVYVREWSNPHAIAVAPDNRHVYVGTSNGTLALARDPRTGALEQAGIFGASEGPLELSPDGTSLYTGKLDSRGPAGGSMVTAFRRDPGSGALAPVAVSGWRTTGRLGDIAVSPDGATVYATDAVNGELAVFARAASDGSLSLLGTATLPPGVVGPSGMAISPDGRWLYVAGRVDESGARVMRYERLPDGTLALAQVADSGASVGETLALSPSGWLYAGASGLTAVRWDAASGELGTLGSGPWISSSGDEPGGAGLAVAGDGMLYAADTWENKLLQARAVEDGFELVKSYRDYEDGVQGLRGLRSIALSPDGANLYAAAGLLADKPGSVAVFARDPDSGRLKFTSLFVPRQDNGEIRVTINGGAEYTDSRRVSVAVTSASPLAGSFWPQLQLSNDGGFRRSSVFLTASHEAYSWTLDSTGPERLPKTVYARGAFIPRFDGNGDPPGYGPPARDTIILDETRPVVVAARRIGARRLRVRARDRLSGVRRLQVARKRGAHVRWRRYGTRRLYAVRRGAVWVRVRDRAGNRSRWHRVRAAGARR